MKSEQQKRILSSPGLRRLLALFILVTGIVWAGWWLWDTYRPASPARWQAHMDAAEKADFDFCTKETHYLAAIKEARKFRKNDIRLAKSLESLADIYDSWLNSYSIEPVTLRSAWGELRNTKTGLSAFLQKIVSLKTRHHILQVCTYARADALFTETLAIYRRVLPANDPQLADILQEMARRKRDPIQSESLYRQALDVIERRYGPESEKIIPYIDILARVHLEQKNFSAAEAESLRIYHIMARKHKPDSDEMLDQYDNLGDIYRRCGDAKTAVSYFQRWLKIEERRYGVTDPALFTTLCILEELYRTIGNQRQQERMEARQNLINKLHPDSPE